MDRGGLTTVLHPFLFFSSDDDDEVDFWLQLPRTFSNHSSRFELPIDMSELTEMTPVEYLSRYVAVSSTRRQLYDKVFVRHRSLKDGMLSDEVSTRVHYKIGNRFVGKFPRDKTPFPQLCSRTHQATVVALEEVMGGGLSKDQQKRLWRYLGIILKSHIVTSFTYRQFSGIAAFVERIFAPEFTPPPTDVVGSNNNAASVVAGKGFKSEIEVADFDRLLSKLDRVKGMKSVALREMLILIKASGEK